ncbi:rhomboid family intramembrane serine protease [Marine Group III euryarchaeote]|nr:rhomboid family intramembrane serine protease [Marine Group III euryarchaeote]
MAIGTLVLLIVGLLVSYYCLRNQFMVSQSLVFINFSIFATWWIIYLLYPEQGVEAIIDLGFKSQYLAEPQFRLVSIITAMFMHGGSMHILMNMLVLILLGVPFEERIGSRSFILIYFISGILGSLITGSVSVFNSEGLNTLNIGASGAVFGIMGGFALLYPRDEIPMLLGPIFLHRVPVILATIVFVAMETFYVGMNTQDGIGHGTHMASFIAGVFLSPLFPKKAISVKQSLKIDEVYLTKLYEKSKKGKYELDMLKAADEPELQSAWLETFLEKQVCLECTNGLDSKGKCLHCNTN